MHVASRRARDDEFAGRRSVDHVVEGGKAFAEEFLEVDAAFRKLGWPMGPCEMGDLVGLDTSWRIRQGRGAVDPRVEAKPKPAATKPITTPPPTPELQRFLAKGLDEAVATVRRTVPR